jgi:hypothetical protein
MGCKEMFGREVTRESAVEKVPRDSMLEFEFDLMRACAEA